MNNKQYLINILDKLISEYGYRNWRRGTLVANELKSWENNKMYFGFNEEEDINKKTINWWN